MRARRLSSGVVVGVIVGLGTAAPAQAGLLDSLNQLVTATKVAVTQTVTQTKAAVDQTVTETQAAVDQTVTQTATETNAAVDQTLQGVFALPGQLAPLSTLQPLLCPPVRDVGELIAPLGLSAIGDGLTALVCNAGLLEYRFATKFRRPDGSLLEREHRATIGVPMLLNVDDDALPDLVGTITITGPNEVGILVDRALGETSQLPVQVEAVLTDPGTGLLGRDHIAVGYDARQDRAPGRFSVSTPIDTILRPTADFRLTVSQQDRGEKIALLGSLFDGTPAARVDPTEVRLDYGASPDLATVRASLSETVAATLTTNRRGPAELSGRIASGLDEDRFQAALTDLPLSLGVTIATGDGLGATYAASDRVATLRGSFEQRRGLALTQKAVLALDDVPTGLTVSQQGDGGSVTTVGGPIGLAKVGVANGEPRFLDDAAYVNLDDDGTVSSVAAQLPGIERASFSLAGAPSLSAKLRSTPLRVRLVEPGQRVEAQVDDLPGEIDLAFDPAGRLTIDGHGQGIESVVASIDTDQPLFGRADRIRADIKGIPALLDAQLTTTDAGRTGLVVGGSGPLRSVELLASNGSDERVAGSDQGIVYRDVPGGEFTVAARVFDLREVTFDPSDLSFGAVTRGGPFSIALQTGDLEATGRVEDLPARAEIGVGSGDRIRFSGKQLDGTPQGIARLTLQAKGSIFGRADRLDAVIEGLPAELELGITPGEDRVEVAATNPIGSIEVVAADRDITDRLGDLPAGGLQGVRYVDRDGVYAIGARILGLKRIAATLGDELGLETETAGGPFRADILTDAITADAVVRDLPAKTAITANLAAGRITFGGKNAADEPQGIQTLDLDLDVAAPLFGRADVIKAHLEDLPAQLTLAVDQDPDGAGVTASDGIGLVELVAANRAVADGDLPGGGVQGAKFVDLTGGDYALGARIRELRTIRVGLGSPVRLTAETAGGPFDLRLDTDALDATAQIRDLPRKLTATLDLAGGKLAFSGRDEDDDPQGIETIDVQAQSATPLFGRATDLAARLTGVPADVMIDLANSGDGARLEADPAIRVIEIAAADRPVDLATDVPDGQRVRLVETPEAYVLGARVEELSLLDAAFGDDIRFNAKTKGGPFDVDVDTADLDATVRLRDLPADVALGLDRDGGQITYVGKDADGDPVGMDSLRASVVSATPFLGRARKIDLEVDKLAPTVTLDLASDGTGGSIQTSEKIDRITLTASDTLEPVDLDAAIGDPQGAVFRDTPGQFLLAARLLDLKSLAFGLAGETIGLRSELRPTPFRVTVDASGLAATARVNALPAKADLAVDLDRGALRFAGRDEDDDPIGIDEITFDATAPATAPLFGAATKLRGRIAQVPPVVDVAFDQTGGAIGVTTEGGPIGVLEFLATNGDETIPADQGIVFRDRTPAGGDREFRIAARVVGLERLTAGLGMGGSDPVALDAQTAGGVFTLDIATDTFQADGIIDRLPAAAKLTADLTTGAIRFQGSDPIERISLSARADMPLFGRADKLDADLQGLPRDVAVQLSQTGGAASVTARDEAGAPVRVGLIEIAAWDDVKQLPPGTSQGVVLQDIPGTRYRLGARIRDLETLTVAFTDAITLETRTAGGPFVADIATPAFSGDVEIIDLPQQLNLGVDLEGGQISYQGSSTIERITANIQSDQPLLMGAKAFFAELAGVPQAFTIGVQPEAGNLSLTASAPIDRIELKAGATRESYPSVRGAATSAGAFLDTTGDLRLAARVFKLQEISVDLEPVTLRAKMQAGLPFAVDARVGQASGTPIDIEADINNLPSDVTLALVEGNGTQLQYSGNAPVDQLKIKGTGLEVLAGASTIEADIRGIPTAFTIALPQTGPVAQLSVANGDRIERLDVAAGRGLLADGTNDRIEYRSTGGTVGLAGRLRGVRSFGVGLNPIAISLAQDTALNRPIDLDATLQQPTGPNTRITGNIAKPSATTNITVNQTTGQPTRVAYTGTGGLTSLNLRAENLGTLPLVDARLTSISSSLSLCFDSGDRCIRAGDPGPARPRGGGNNFQPKVSVDAVSNSTGFVILNADIVQAPGQAAIQVRDLRFRNIAFDLTQGNNDSAVGLTVPRVAVFLDTNNAPFVLENIVFDSIQAFRLGTVSQPASAQNRFLRVDGIRRFLGVPTGINQVTSGSLNCGGRRELRVSGIDVLNLPIIGQAVSLCG